MRLGEVTAQQVEREGVAGDVFDEVLEFDCGSPDAEGFQKFDAGGGGEVLQFQHRCGGVAEGRQVGHSLAGGHQAEAGIALGQAPEQGSQCGITELAGQRTGRVLQRLQAVEDEQSAALRGELSEALAFCHAPALLAARSGSPKNSRASLKNRSAEAALAAPAASPSRRVPWL